MTPMELALECKRVIESPHEVLAWLAAQGLVEVRAEVQHG